MNQTATKKQEVGGWRVGGGITQQLHQMVLIEFKQILWKFQSSISRFATSTLKKNILVRRRNFFLSLNHNIQANLPAARHRVLPQQLLLLLLLLLLHLLSPFFFLLKAFDRLKAVGSSSSYPLGSGTASPEEEGHGATGGSGPQRSYPVTH